MLLIPFVENSFKHGVIIEGKLSVNITIKTQDDLLNFSIENTSKKESNSQSGIGLENIKKRLDLLYPNAYNLLIEEKENTYLVNLSIKLNSLKAIANAE